MWLCAGIMMVVGHLCVANTVPSKCCMMNQWEAIMGTVDVTISSHYQNIRPGTKYVSMDEDNKRLAVVSQYTEGEPRTFKTISDFNNKKQYKIEGGNCTVSALYVNMLPNCIPADAQYLGSSYVGGGNIKIPFDSWNYFIAGWNVNISISVSQGDCIPLAEEVLTLTTDMKSSMTAVFTTFTPGIKDPNVFVPPSDCKPQHKQEATNNIFKVDQQANRT